MEQAGGEIAQGEEAQPEEVGQGEGDTSEVFSREEYSRPSFWNDRFRENPKAFDWYVTWRELRKFLLILTHHEDFPSVLMVGCGSSTLSEDMGKSGYDVTNVDISDVILRQMASESQQEFLQVDATRCPFRSQSFDLVLDKGTFDALACSPHSPLPDLVISEMARLARGALIIITHGKPELRLSRFQAAIAPHGVWKHRALPCELSPIAQFINIMRARNPEKSIGSVLRDKVSLAAALSEMAAYMQSKNSEGGEKRQTHCWVYFFFRQVEGGKERMGV